MLAQLVVHFMTDPAAGLTRRRSVVLTVEVVHASFEQWWDPFTLGVGPAGSYVAGLTARRRAELRSRCAAALAADLTTCARAWTVMGRAR